jgi:glycosyltransferase involved in cell wall biosynthesis
VEQAEAGAVVPAGDPAALADCIARFASDEALANERGQNGRRFVEQNLQWSAIVGKWLAHLDSPGAVKTVENTVLS